VPATASGECHVRVFVQGAKHAALGAADVTIEPVAAQARGRAAGTPGG
jgi:hypothetical protein